MKIHNYSQDTGEAISATEARESPMETGVPLIPAYATPDAPPAAPAGYAAAFLDPHGVPPQNYKDGTWQICEDHRGVYYDTATGQQVLLTALSVSPEQRGLTSLVPGADQVWSGSGWVDDQAKLAVRNNARLRAEIQRIELEEQPAAQRAFVLTGDKGPMQVVQNKIDALQAQISE